jgi:hypothetical protein
MERPLYTTRAGRARQLSESDFIKLIWRSVIAWARREELFAEAFEEHRVILDDVSYMAPGRIADVDAFLLDKLNTSVLSIDDLLRSGKPQMSLFVDADLVLDLMELLHAECISAPATLESAGYDDTIAVSPFDQAKAQRLFRERLNVALAKHPPPLEMRPNGHIVELPPEDMQPLVDEPLPDDLEPELRDPIEAAIDRFYRRGATDADRLDAVRHLAAALERLRPRIKTEMLKKDEGALFDIANNFSIRHNNAIQQGDYDRGVWLEWIFHVYLATVRMLIRVQAQQSPS